MRNKIVILLILAIILVSVPVLAAEAPVTYHDTITVTNDGGSYQVGFINLEFKKDFLDDSMLPATFDVDIYAENGVGYIELQPSTPLFNKAVHIRVNDYHGLLYDRATGENIEVSSKHQQILANHFSRYIFW